ncbi:BamA/TamA family outer membrane protein [Psychrilyobacter sp.]|uniref:BamA/TamA family outer membrane protein n=1 Tax=Psychrilyobacter sp. TaxID=2586924 RepID=UPI0030167E48
MGSDSRDKSHFSNKGVKNTLSLFTGGDIEGNESVEFNGLLFDMHQHIPIKKKFNLELFISGGNMDGSEIPESEYFKIGGLRNDLKTNQFSFYGMNAMRKYAEEFYMAGINIRYKLNASIYINMKYNAVTYNTPTNFITTEDSEVGKDFKHGVGIGLGWDSLVGPLEIVISNDADVGGILLSLFLGYEF